MNNNCLTLICLIENSFCPIPLAISLLSNNLTLPSLDKTLPSVVVQGKNSTPLK